MAVIPYRSTLAPGAAPSTVQNINVPADNAMGNALKDMAVIADKHYQKVDEANATTAFNEYRTKANTVRQDYTQQKGLNAFNNLEQYQTSLKEARELSFKGVTTPRAQRMLTSAMDKADVSYLDSGASHAGQELNTALDNEAKTQIALETDEAVHLRQDQIKLVEARNRAIDIIKATGVRNGAGQNTIDAAILGATSKLNSQVVRAFIADKDFDRARAFFDEPTNSSGMTEKDKADLTSLLDKGEILSKQQTAFDALVETHGDDSAALTAAAKLLEKGELRSGVEGMVKTHIATAKTAEAENIRQIKIAVNQFINEGGDPDQILNNPDWATYYSVSDINTIKTDLVKQAGFGIDYTESQQIFVDMQFTYDKLSRADKISFLDNLDAKGVRHLHINDQQKVLDWMSYERSVELDQKETDLNPKQAMLSATREVVSGIFDENFQPGKGDASKMLYAKRKNLLDKILSAVANEAEWQKDNVAFKEKVRKITSALMLEDDDNFFQSDGYLFENLYGADSVLNNDDVAQDFFEELEGEDPEGMKQIREELTRALSENKVGLSDAELEEAENKTHINLMKIYLLNQGMDINNVN